MSGVLKRVNSGWLARSVEDAKRVDASTRNWVVKVRNNWIDSARDEETHKEKEISKAT